MRGGTMWSRGRCRSWRCNCPRRPAAMQAGGVPALWDPLWPWGGPPPPDAEEEKQGQTVAGHQGAADKKPKQVQQEPRR